MLVEYIKFLSEDDLAKMKIEDIKQEYDNLIKFSLLRGLDKEKYPDTHLEKHHIVPHCLGGNDENDNLVLLTVKEHIYAHLYLYYMHPKVTSLEFTVNWMIPSRKSKGYIDESLFADRERIWACQAYRKVSIEGSKEREEYIKLQSAIGKQRMSDPNMRKRISKTLLARKDKSSLKQRARRVINDNDGTIFPTITECAKFYGVTNNAIRCRIQHYEHWGLRFYDPPAIKGKRIQGPNGVVYKSLRECSRETGHSRKTIASWMKLFPERGYKYVED